VVYGTSPVILWLTKAWTKCWGRLGNTGKKKKQTSGRWRLY